MARAEILLCTTDLQKPITLEPTKCGSRMQGLCHKQNRIFREAAALLVWTGMLWKSAQPQACSSQQHEWRLSYVALLYCRVAVVPAILAEPRCHWHPTPVSTCSEEI